MTPTGGRPHHQVIRHRDTPGSPHAIFERGYSFYLGRRPAPRPQRHRLPFGFASHFLSCSFPVTRSPAPPQPHEQDVAKRIATASLQPAKRSDCTDFVANMRSNSHMAMITVSFSGATERGAQDMPPPHIKTSSETSFSATDAEMAKHGITRVPVDDFHYQEFRYTNLKDAVAQAKREKEAG